MQRNGILITRTHMNIGFADDIDLIGINRRAVEEACVPLKRETARINLTINSNKTKYLIAGRDRDSPSGISAEVVIDGDVIEAIEEFVYLGILVTSLSH